MGENRMTDGDLGDLLSAEAFQRFLDLCPCGLFRYHAEGEGAIDIVSQQVLALMGCATHEEFMELTGGTFPGIVHPDDRPQVLRSIEEQIAQGSTDAVTYRLNRADGREVWVDDRGRYVVDAAGTPWFYVSIADITDQVRAERALKRSHERMEILTALSNDVVFDIECGTGRTDVFGDFQDRFGREPRQEDFVVQKRCNGHCCLDITLHDLDRLMADVGDDSLVDFETSTPGPDGQPVWYRYQSVVIYDDEGHPVRHVGRLLDTHDMALRESQFRRKAEHDSLTGLYNRSAALNRIETALKSEARPLTLFLIDVDDFKSVNDTYGHPEGDRLLVSLAEFLTNAMRREDVVARLGGDEFAVFANGLGRGPALDRIVEHLVRGPFAAERATDDEAATPYSASISVGIVCCDKGEATFEDLYAAADKALYQAKQGGKAQAAICDLGD